MTENLKAFADEVNKNEELKNKLTALNNDETAKGKVIEIAKDYGFTLTEEDFEAKGAEGELSEDELNAVAGGFCVFHGGGGGLNCGCAVLGAS